MNAKTNIVLLMTLMIIGITDGKRSYFNYTVINSLQEPKFRVTTYLPIMPHMFLINYMEAACLIEPDKFTNYTVTYFPKYEGYFINAINGVVGNEHIYWIILNYTSYIPVGVSAYIPKPNDAILFNLTRGTDKRNQFILN